MKLKLLILIICSLLLVISEAYSQDIHFSQYQASPVLLNASNTARFDGDYRMGLNYRNQWSSFIKPFVTYSGFFDKLFKIEMLGKDYFGAGLVLYSDKAGTAEFSTQSVLGSLAYHKILDANGKHSLSVGVQGGVVQKGLNYDNLKFGNQYESVFYNSELESKENFAETSIIYPEVNVGMGWKYDFSEKLDLEAGISMFNLNQPKESFFRSTDNKLNRRLTLNLGADYIYSDMITISPGILFSGQTKAYEYLLGSTVGYKVKEIPLLKVVALLGLWYRSSDALIIVPGIVYNNYRFGLSYDVNISSLRAASKGQGAVELSLIYILNINPKLGIKKSLPCKRL